MVLGLTDHRWTVAELLFGRLQRVFSRFDTYARRYLAVVHVASTVIWLT